MWLIPYKRIAITTLLSPEAARQRVIEVVEPRRFVRVPPIRGPYQGTVQNNTFKATRIITYRNSFLPVVCGSIEPNTTGSTVHITFRPNLFVLVLMTMWLGCVTFFLTIGIVSQAVELIVGTAFMWVVGYGMWLGGFVFEARKAEAFFTELFNQRVQTSNISH